MGKKTVTCLLFVTIQLINAITTQEMIKRVPQGFLGMRGKKYLDPDEPDHFYKRKPQFFVGVKGKKNSLDSLEELENYYKRVPMGFVGMRGKKLYSDLVDSGSIEFVPKRAGSLIGQIDYASNDELPEQYPEFPMLDELLAEYLSKYRKPVEEDSSNLSNARMTNEIEKRAANIHQFFGVRGKKSIQTKRPFDLTFRGKFIGVRGKKDLKNSGAQEIKFLLENGPWTKRKGMGFFGMRGKKWNEETEGPLSVETSPDPVIETAN